MQINEKIFREYDIRGIYNEDLTDELAYIIGRSFGSYIDTNEVIVGYDNRVSSIALHENLTRGLIESGINVTSIGLVTTPMYYSAKKLYKFKCGIMITASHNPKEYNGFKISFDYVGPACGKEIFDFKDFTLKGEFKNGTGSLIKKDIKNDYINLVKNSINLGDRKVKVVVDCGNGTGSVIINDLMDSLNLPFYPLFCDSNPEFPNHHPDPSVPENLTKLSEKVTELGYDIGIAFDGDADRVGLVDELGNVIPADMIMDIFYRSLKDTINPKKAIYDVKCSNALKNDLVKMGYDVTMYRTGTSYLNRKINEDNYMFGGEFAGHLWFKDKYLGFDDGIYAGLRLIEILSNSEATISSLLNGIEKFVSTKEIKVHVTDENKFKIVEFVKDYAISKNYDVYTIDGVRVEFDNAFALVRASNTGPDLTLRFEAKNENKLNEIKEEFENIINNYINTH